LNQKKYLIDKVSLIDKLKQLKESLDVEFEDIDGATLPEEYSDLLLKNYNPNIERPMKKKIVNEGQKNGYIYFGQFNSQEQMDGIGTILFHNGFCYQGMFEKGHREGLGITHDIGSNKYKGEHRDGMRQGRGKIKMKDGKEYTGGWNKNKMHGRGRENYQNDNFLVYYNNGWREQVLARGDKDPNS
jgi:hypothetical protein